MLQDSDRETLGFHYQNSKHLSLSLTFCKSLFAVLTAHNRKSLKTTHRRRLTDSVTDTKRPTPGILGRFIFMYLKCLLLKIILFM